MTPALQSCFEKIFQQKSLPQIIILTAISVRMGFMLVMGSDSFVLHADTYRYFIQSSQILNLDFNLKTPLFISAPVYPIVMATFRVIFQEYWISALQVFQILLSALSVFYLYKIALLLLDQKTARITAVLFIFYPFTLWWVYTFTQDSLFQSFFIFFLYFLVAGVVEKKLYKVFISALLFGISYMTKSHILIFTPFIFVYIYLNWKKFSLKNHLLYCSIIFLISAPYSIYHLLKNGIFVVGSTGGGAHFLIGHNEDAYTYLIETPEMGTEAYRRLAKMDLQILTDQKLKLKTLTHAQQQELFFQEGLKWSVENPVKSIKLALNNFISFLWPGISWKHYPLHYVFIALFISLPVYCIAYVYIVISLKKDFNTHSWVLFLFLACMAFSVVFYVQNRFRTITIEPIYLMYAALGLSRFSRTEKIKNLITASGVRGSEKA